MFENRTDLALEERESFEGNGGEIGGVALRDGAVMAVRSG